jgi:hypothetical protein
LVPLAFRKTDGNLRSRYVAVGSWLNQCSTAAACCKIASINYVRAVVMYPVNDERPLCRANIHIHDLGVAGCYVPDPLYLPS